MIGGLSKNATLFEASGSTDLKDDILRRPVPVAKQLLHKDRYSLLRGKIVSQLWAIALGEFWSTERPSKELISLMVIIFMFVPAALLKL